jgi:hypothetical protein
MVIRQAPIVSAVEALNFVARCTESLAKLQVIPVIASGEFKTLMETAKQGVASYAHRAIDRRIDCRVTEPNTGLAHAPSLSFARWRIRGTVASH